MNWLGVYSILSERVIISFLRQNESSGSQGQGKEIKQMRTGATMVTQRLSSDRWVFSKVERGTGVVAEYLQM